MKFINAILMLCVLVLLGAIIYERAYADEVDNILRQWQAWEGVRHTESYMYQGFPRNDQEYHDRTLERLNQQRIADELYRQNWLLERGVRK